jgi:hypothetical protein
MHSPIAAIDFDGVMTVNSRPSRDSHDRPLYGKQFSDMEFDCRSGILQNQSKLIALISNLLGANPVLLNYASISTP